MQDETVKPRIQPGGYPASPVQPGDTPTNPIRPPTRARNTNHLTVSLEEGSEFTTPQVGAAPPAGTSATNAGTKAASVVPSKFNPSRTGVTHPSTLGRRSEIQNHHLAVGVGPVRTLGRTAEIRARYLAAGVGPLGALDQMVESQRRHLVTPGRESGLLFRPRGTSGSYRPLRTVGA